jgi:mRNA-degrading endonuclease RelE of RelBE toxin-antitoxin system
MLAIRSDKELEKHKIVYAHDVPTISGDSLQPLKGDYTGLWRYRVGDYRILDRILKSSG